MKVWPKRHGATLATITLAASLAWTGCREESTPDAAPGGEKPATTTSEATPRAELQAQETAEREAPPQPTIPVGTELSGNLETAVSTDKSHVGDPVRIRTSRAVTIDQRALIPAGSKVHGTVTHVRTAGRMRGAAELTARFTEVELPDGTSYPVTCEPFRLVVKGDGKETAAEIGGGAAIGGILGGVVGGGDGALKGAAVGAAVGTGVAAATKGEQISLPAGKPISLRLSAPLTL